MLSFLLSDKVKSKQNLVFTKTIRTIKWHRKRRIITNEEKHTNTGDTMATDEVKVQSLGDEIKIGPGEVCFTRREALTRGWI